MGNKRAIMAVSPTPGFLDVIKHHRMFSRQHRTLGKEEMEGRPDTTDEPSAQPQGACRQVPGTSNRHGTARLANLGRCHSTRPQAVYASH